MAGRPADAQSDIIAQINSGLERVAGVADTVQDSINLSIKAGMRTLLERDDALHAGFAELRMTRVDAPDGAFRLFTWNLPRSNGQHHFEGLLLVRTASGHALHELRDMTARIPSPEVSELGPDRWYGALYYEVIPRKKGATTYYTLLGWKGYSRAETRKVIDVLSLKGGKPRFGAPLFGKGRLRSMRKVYGFAFHATMSLRYDPSLEAIIMDHLSPSREDLKDNWAFYGPDMTHDSYFWHKGGWWFGPDIDLRAPFKAGSGQGSRQRR